MGGRVCEPEDHRDFYVTFGCEKKGPCSVIDLAKNRRPLVFCFEQVCGFSNRFVDLAKAQMFAIQNESGEQEYTGHCVINLNPCKSGILNYSRPRKMMMFFSQQIGGQDAAVGVQRRTQARIRAVLLTLAARVVITYQ